MEGPVAAKKLTPAEVVIHEFGIRPLARDIDVDPTTIVRWRNSDDGLVPSQYHVPLLALAKQQERRLTAEELVYGRTVKA